MGLGTNAWVPLNSLWLVLVHAGKASLVPRPFPPDRFQYEIRRGKAWEIWSHVMTSGRHMGGVPNRYKYLFHVNLSLALWTTNGINRLPWGGPRAGWEFPSLDNTHLVGAVSPQHVHSYIRAVNKQITNSGRNPFMSAFICLLFPFESL